VGSNRFSLSALCVSLQFKFTAKQAGCPACPVVVAESRNGTATFLGLTIGTKVILNAASCEVAMAWLIRPQSQLRGMHFVVCMVGRCRLFA